MQSLVDRNVFTRRIPPYASPHRQLLATHLTIQSLIFCWPCISIYLFLNINQLDALNFIISLFQASVCFEHMCSSSGGQKLYYTASRVITPIGGSPVHILCTGRPSIGVMIPETV